MPNGMGHEVGYQERCGVLGVGERCNSYGARGFSRWANTVLLGGVLFFGLLAHSAEAAPWWWAMFSKGDGVTQSSGPFERYIAQFVMSAQQTDTVYVASYKWGSGTNDVVNGSGMGVNTLFAQRGGGSAPVRVVGDGDEYFPGSALYTTLNPAVPTRFSAPNTGHVSHNKIITIGTNAVMTGSTNLTASGTSSEPNNMVIIRVPSVAKAYLNEMDDEFNNGNFIENTPSPKTLHTAPNGDRIETYFMPDDANNINTSPYAAGSDLAGVLNYRANNANESIFYMINVLSNSQIAGFLNSNASSKLVEGWLDNDPSGFRTSLQNSHTSRDWNNFASDEGHHKVMIFDMDIVEFGSANHTGAAMTSPTGNTENMVVVSDFRMARKFMQEYKRSMRLIPQETTGQADSFDNTPPGGITGLTAVDVLPTSNQLQLSWTGPNNSDLSRYYVFISTSSFGQSQIGDGLDADNDGYIDEDPPGDADGFSSGLGGVSPADDDADGLIDEDPWMYPEIQVKNQTPGAKITTTIQTVNAGDLLLDNTNYWIGVVAVDKHGNEGPLSVTGPVQSKVAVVGALPVASIGFDTGASNVVSTLSTLKLAVGNKSSALQPITTVVADFQSAVNSETLSAAAVQPAPPTSWTLYETGQTLTWVTNTAVDYIDPGETVEFRVAVTNSPNTGPSAAVTVSVTDAQNIVTANVPAGSVTLVAGAPGAPPPPAGNGISSMTAKDAVNTISTFVGPERLLKTAITLNYTLAKSATTGSEVWYDINKNPDGPGGLDTTDKLVSATGGAGKTFSAVIPGATDAAIKNGVQVRFLVLIDGTISDTNNGNYYRFTIDDTVSMPSGLAVSSTGFNDVTLTWNAIGDGDFSRYDIFYSTSSPVGIGSPSVTITNQSQTSLQLGGLALNTTYYFAIMSRDNLGNVSGLSPQVSGKTKQGFNVTVADLTDGSSHIAQAQLDGTGLLTDNSITVSFTLDQVPASSSDVQLWYDAGGNSPDGPGGVNPNDKQVFAAGSGLNWQAVIPGSDPLIVNNATVKFVFVIGGQVLSNLGVPFKFKVVETVTAPPGNFMISDTTGTGFTFTWSPLSIQSNFGGYRIYYSTDTPTLASPYWDRSQDVNLYYASVNQTTVTNLAPNTKYNFKIAGADALGNVGPLSTQQTGTTGYRGSVLITEVGVEESPEFVEIEAVVGPVDVSGFQITDLDVAPVTLAASALTLQKGQRAVIWLTAGADETDATGDANGNGYRDIYAAGPALPATTDELVLLASTGDTIDAVVYRGTKLNTIDATDLAALTPTHWTGADSAGAVRAFTSVAYQRTPSIARKKDVTGSRLSDVNARTDWEVVTDTTPGAVNNFMAISSVSISDTSTVGAVRTASVLSGQDKLKGGPYRLKFILSQFPTVSGGLKFWYDTNADPDGRGTASVTDAPIAINIPAGSKSIDTDVAIPEAKNGREIRFIFTSENDPTNPDAQDEIKMTRNTASYRFTIDLTGPDTPTGLKIIDKTIGGLKAIWTPIIDPGDFAYYILFYDTGPVTTSSKSWSFAQDPVLTNPSATATQLNGLLSNINYNLRLAAVDALGNISGLSDTASETTVAPVKANVVTATDGVNTIDNFSGSARLKQTSNTIKVTFDRTVTNPVLYWNTSIGSPADGPGGNADSTVVMTTVTSNQYSCTLPVLSNDSTVFFVFNTDAGVIKNVTTAFSYKIDGAAGDSVGQFKFGGYFDVGPNRNTSVAVTWSPLSATTYPDFLEYRIYYQRGDTVTVATGNLWGPVKAPILRDIRAGGTAVQNLAPNDTYSMMIVWVDQIGNQAPVSDTFRVVTINAVPFADPATDGLNVAHILDGTEWLMKSNITVSFEFTSRPMDPSSAVLKWNVGGGDVEAQSRTVQVFPRAWDPLVYDGVIAGATDPLITDGCMVNYALWADGIKFDNYGVDFKFKVDATPPYPLTGVKVIDNGSSLTAIWDPTGMSDFNTYRIRYRQSTTGTWTYLDKWNKPILGNIGASNLTFAVSTSGHYYVNVATVDQAGHEAWQSVDKVIKRGAALDPALTLDQTRLIKVIAGQTVPLTATIRDMDGLGWAGQPVTFEIQSDLGVWKTNGLKTITTTTDAAGLAQSILQTDASTDREVYFVRATSPAVPGFETFYRIIALGDEKQKSQTWIWEVHVP